MYYKKMILLCLVPLSLFAAEKKADTKELFDYSTLHVNNSLSVYAAKVNMQNFEEEHAYSIGLLHQSTDLNTEIGIGYMQPVDQVNALLDPTVFRKLYLQDDGVLFFMHYHF